MTAIVMLYINAQHIQSVNIAFDFFLPRNAVQAQSHYENAARPYNCHFYYRDIKYFIIW